MDFPCYTLLHMNVAEDELSLSRQASLNSNWILPPIVLGKMQSRVTKVVKD